MLSGTPLYVSEQKSRRIWFLNKYNAVQMMILSIFDKNRRMPHGIRLTELEQGKILAYKDSGMSIHQIAEKLNRSRKVISNFLRDPSSYIYKKKRGVRRKISEKAQRRLLRAASNQITSASKLQRSMQLNISVRRVQQVLQAAPYLRYRKMRAVPWMTERHFTDRVDWVQNHISWNSDWANVIFSDEKSSTWMALMDLCITGMMREKTSSI